MTRASQSVAAVRRCATWTDLFAAWHWNGPKQSKVPASQQQRVGFRHHDLVPEAGVLIL
ncbi:hypothetical protein KQ933_16275 [Rhizobium sp. WYJ-E13]|nr:hypothetical protein KQ933_16275 [Rhizobium sp. WYJ-E13]